VVAPREGSLLLPLDGEWREVSGYTEPEDYAPHVAARLVRCIRDHASAPQASRDDDRRLPARAEQHAMLLEVLERQGQVEPAWPLEHFDELFASTPREERFLVFWEGDVTTSTREKVPPAKRPFPPLRETRRRLAEARASGRDFGWFAHAPGSRD
jgi:hypothetical protein